MPGTDPLRVAQPATFPGDSSTITGFRNLAALALDDNMYLQTSDNTIGPAFLPTDPYGLDTEGLQRDPRDGSYWLSDEYRPSIVHLDRHGVMLQRIVPAGNGAQDTDATAATVPLSDFYDGPAEPKLQELLPAEWKARRQNRGLEGLAMSADGTKLYAMMQNPLDTRNNSDIDPLTAGTQDLYKTFGYGDSNGVTGGRCDGVTTGPENTGGAGSTNFYRNVRIAELDISNPASPVVTGEFIYRLDLQNAGDSAIQGRQRMSDIAWAGPRKLLVDEHDDDALAVTGTAVGRRIHEVDLNGATNLVDGPGVRHVHRARDTGRGPRRARRHAADRLLPRRRHRRGARSAAHAGRARREVDVPRHRLGARRDRLRVRQARGRGDARRHARASRSSTTTTSASTSPRT